jgi:hypothetical protein
MPCTLLHRSLVDSKGELELPLPRQTNNKSSQLADTDYRAELRFGMFHHGYHTWAFGICTGYPVWAALMGPLVHGI